MPGDVHHVFPYDPEQLGLSADAWIDSQLQRWPLAAVSLAKTAPRSTVHFITRHRIQLERGGLRFQGHAARWTGPQWWHWGDDWSRSLGATLRGLLPNDLCVLHLDTYFAAQRAHFAARHTRVAIVLHGKGFGGPHIREADAIVSLRQDVADTLAAEGYPSDRLFAAIPSIGSQFLADPKREPPPPLRLGFVGVPSPSKGMEELTCTVELLVEAGRDFSLEIIGAPANTAVDSYRARLGAAGDRVRFLGQLASAEVARKMSSWHLLLHPSWSEGCPMVVLEALGLGVSAVLATNVVSPELASQQGIHAFPRESYAALVVSNADRLAETRCSREMILDHARGAHLWEKLDGLTRRNAAVSRPPTFQRYWRLRPLQAWVHRRPWLRESVRKFRKASGMMGGLASR